MQGLAVLVAAVAVPMLLALPVFQHSVAQVDLVAVAGVPVALLLPKATVALVVLVVEAAEAAA